MGSSKRGDDGKFGTKKSNDIGEGRSNTEIIVSRSLQGKADNAAMACVMYSGGGYSDWFLPSKDELCLMFDNLGSKGIENFKNDWYWPSSEVYNNCFLGMFILENVNQGRVAWTEKFSGYNDYMFHESSEDYIDYLRGNKYYVRPIRAF